MAHQGSSILAGIAVGAGLMFFLDPERGRTRRTQMRHRVNRAARAGSQALGATGRDVASRASDAAARLRHPTGAGHVDAATLAERVRSHLGRAVSFPAVLRVDVEMGVVTLSGPVLATEVPRLVRTVERIRGVREVVAAVDEHETHAGIAAMARTATAGATDFGSWSPTARLLAGTTGVTLAGMGASRGGAAGALLAAAGVGLIARVAMLTAREPGTPARAAARPLPPPAGR